ncbi:hypothetical protein SISSUDRAFT_1065717 [Sistotremastrum suecicum HHB10207 ss-3]|uniref:Uncharacterized protein n=1 Tax=Sistotremastrum suecicum HHB10207 ss-3 TaxID=1314776 RepID=A0A165Z5P8_9AGAM|nr:hypothetical protein SISSUDRAFT_1065717 [Sistotremastrum suecicum HHB10207 ss-3]
MSRLTLFWLLVLLPSFALSAINGIFPAVKYPGIHSIDYPIEFSTTSMPEIWTDYTVIIGWSKCQANSHATLGDVITGVVDLVNLNTHSTAGESFIVNLALEDRFFDVRTRTTFQLIATVTSGIGRSGLLHVERYSTNITVDPRYCGESCQSKIPQDYQFQSQCRYN